jgi:hypothetical protein
MTMMPHTFEEILDETDNRMFVLHETWCIYRQLFGTSEARVDLLNDVAPGVAGVVQPVLLDSVILGICRFCDKASMSGNENLSLKRLIDALDPKPDATQAAYFANQLAKIDSLSQALGKHRHKRIAHNDLKSAMAEKDILPPVSRQTVEDALAAIRELLNTIHVTYFTGPYAYEHPLIRGDGNDLIWYLQLGQRMLKFQTEVYSRDLDRDKFLGEIGNLMFEKL